MRVKFIILAIGMLAYGYYIHGFTEQAKAQVAQMQHSYEQAISVASQSSN